MKTVGIFSTNQNMILQGKQTDILLLYILGENYAVFKFPIWQNFKFRILNKDALKANSLSQIRTYLAPFNTFYRRCLFFLIFIWLHWVLVVGSLVPHADLSLQSTGSSLRRPGSRARRLSSCGTWALQLWRAGSLVVAHRLQNTQAQLPHDMWDLSSTTRDQTRIPCIGRQILNHWTTREVPTEGVLMLFSTVAVE